MSYGPKVPISCWPLREKAASSVLLPKAIAAGRTPVWAGPSRPKRMPWIPIHLRNYGRR